MKVVSLIPSFNPHHEFLEVVINELNKYSQVILFTTKDHELPVSKTIMFDPSIGRDLVYKPREWVRDNIEDDWDFALYNEDDILIPEQSFHNVVSLYRTLPSPFIPGFIRYEFDHRDNSKRYFDMNPVHAVHRGVPSGTVKHKWNDTQVWEPWNLHSGNWLFSREDIRNMIDSELWETHFKQYGFQYGNCDQLESSASTPYLFYTKVYPNNFEMVECRHLPTKYVNFSINPTNKDLTKLL